MGAGCLRLIRRQCSAPSASCVVATPLAAAIDFLLAHDYELSRNDADLIGQAVSQFLSDSALFTTSART